MELIRGEKTIAYQTLGCKLNFSETSTIARSFSEKNYTRVNSSEKADVYVINTCSVTDQADKKCRQLVKKLIKQNPKAFIAVVGCYAQLKPSEIAEIPGVDIVLGTKDKFNLPTYLETLEKKETPEIHGCEFKEIENFDPSYSSADRTRTFLKIQDGCDYFCSYCTIPLARGKSRNAGIQETIEQAKKVAKTGTKEIILTGVNIGDFGQSSDENFFKVRDMYETWVARNTLRPIYFNRDVDEGGYLIDVQHTYDWTDSLAYINTKKTNKPARVDTIPLIEHTHNILSVFYYSRNAGYHTLNIQDSIPIHFLMDSKIEMLKYCFKGTEERKIGHLGKFNSLHFTAPLIQGSLFKEGDEVEFWVSNDKNLIPLWVESPIIVGSVRAKLIHVENLKHAFESKIED